MLKLKFKGDAHRFVVYGAVAVGLAASAFSSAHAEEVSFKDTILPILKERCFSCHGPKKSKGELRLDSLEGINAGGENGKVLVAGKPDESPLYKLTILPKDDPDIMPAKGDALTEEQTKAIFNWITEGAKFGDWKAEEPEPETAAPAQGQN